MKRTRISQGLFAAGLLVLTGCSSAPQQPTAAPAPEKAEPTVRLEEAQEMREAYSAALDDAFKRYEGEIAEAAQITYHSEAELTAVRTTLSEDRFDYQLREALHARDLNVAGLAKFALDNPGFFHSEQSRHWGRLAEAQDRLAQLQVQPVQLAMVDTGETH